MTSRGIPELLNHCGPRRARGGAGARGAGRGLRWPLLRCGAEPSGGSSGEGSSSEGSSRGAPPAPAPALLRSGTARGETGGREWGPALRNSAAWPPGRGGRVSCGAASDASLPRGRQLGPAQRGGAGGRGGGRSSGCAEGLPPLPGRRRRGARLAGARLSQLRALSGSRIFGGFAVVFFHLENG